MIQETEKMKIAALNLDAIKAKLMDSESGEGWSCERADAVEIEYRRFLFLMKAYPAEPASPFLDVDTFWHYHILDTQNYAADCQFAFGYFLHHVPSLDTTGPTAATVHQQAGDRMRDIYERTFGGPAGGARESAYCGASQAASYCGVATPESAYCGAAKAATAYRGATARTAYCGAPGARTAYCGAAIGTTAYCGATMPQTV